MLHYLLFAGSSTEPTGSTPNIILNGGRNRSCDSNYRKAQSVASCQQTTQSQVHHMTPAPLPLTDSTPLAMSIPQTRQTITPVSGSPRPLGTSLSARENNVDITPKMKAMRRRQMSDLDKSLVQRQTSQLSGLGQERNDKKSIASSSTRSSTALLLRASSSKSFYANQRVSMDSTDQGLSIPLG